MIAVALAQIRVHWARFTAIGLGIALAAGFVSATLIVNSSLQESMREGIGATFARADVVVLPAPGAAIEPAEVAALTQELSGVPGVRAVEVSATAIASARGSGVRDTDFAVAPAPVDPRLDTFSITTGTRPIGPTDLVLSADTAADLGLRVGDTLRFSTGTARIDTDADSQPIYRGPRHSATDFTVVGLAEMGNDPRYVGTARAMTTSASYREHFARTGDVSAIQIGTATGTEPAEVGKGIEAALGGTVLAERMETMTVDEAVDRKVAEFSEGSDFIAWMLLGCAGISVVVAVLVVSNTFSVIVAGRRRELALLRCIGASRSQLYGSVLVEGVIVGVVGSILGVLAGVGVSAVLIGIVAEVWQRELSYVSLSVPAWTLIAGVVVGVLLTLSATIRPARAAIAVTPLEALQPFDVPSAPTSGSRARRLLGWGSIGLGIVAVALSLIFAAASGVWVLVGALGGTLVVIGLVLCSGEIIPPVVSWFGDLVVSPWGLPGQLATLNTLRNRRRTGSTAAALVIGVTLVSTLVVGGMSTKATFGAGLTQHFPVDVAVNLGNAADQDVVDRIRGIDGVDTAALAYHAAVVDSEAELYIVDPDSLSALLGESAPTLVPGRVTVPEDFTGDTVQVRGLTTASLPVEKSGESDRVYFTTADVGNRIGVSAASTAVLITLRPDQSVTDVLRIRQDVAEALDVTTDEVIGSAVDRGLFAQVIDILLLMAVGVLLIAVLIALIGVSNTISLSVIERRRENSLLRALGLSLTQLRALLAFEAVLISVVSALIGLALGGALGIVGTRLITVDFSNAFVVDWSIPASLGILAVAVVAGILSALAPARRASRLSPVEGLKQEN